VNEPRDEDHAQREDDALPLDPAPLDPAVERLLGDLLVWDEPPPGLEDAVVAAIVAEREVARPVAGAHPPAEAGAAAANDELAARRHRGARGRSWVRPFAAGAAAAAVLVLVVAGATALGGDDDQTGGQLVALAGTELAPDASADATVVDTPLGTVVELDVRGLDPAPEGTYYQAWLREPGAAGESVSVGTFHLRGGDGEVELWGGVSPEQYPVLTVTLQQEGAGPASSGEVVLRGEATG